MPSVGAGAPFPGDTLTSTSVEGASNEKGRLGGSRGGQWVL